MKHHDRTPVAQASRTPDRRNRHVFVAIIDELCDVIGRCSVFHLNKRIDYAGLYLAGCLAKGLVKSVSRFRCLDSAKGVSGHMRDIFIGKHRGELRYALGCSNSPELPAQELFCIIGFGFGERVDEFSLDLAANGIVRRRQSNL